jgi:hypothetical protein
VVTVIPLHTIGVHDGLARDIARALRASCRPTSAAWTTPPLDFDAAARRIHDWARHRPQPEADAVTWAPGHDGSAGPGYAFAALVAEAWQLPLVEALHRRTPVPSAHRSTRRATLDEQLASLHTRRSTRRLIVVDNTATKGTTLRAVIARLHRERVIVTATAAAASAATSHTHPPHHRHDEEIRREHPNHRRPLLRLG